MADSPRIKRLEKPHSQKELLQLKDDRGHAAWFVCMRLATFLFRLPVHQTYHDSQQRARYLDTSTKFVRDHISAPITSLSTVAQQRKHRAYNTPAQNGPSRRRKVAQTLTISESRLLPGSLLKSRHSTYGRQCAGMNRLFKTPAWKWKILALLAVNSGPNWSLSTKTGCVQRRLNLECPFKWKSAVSRMAYISSVVLVLTL